MILCRPVRSRRLAVVQCREVTKGRALFPIPGRHLRWFPFHRRIPNGQIANQCRYPLHHTEKISIRCGTSKVRDFAHVTYLKLVGVLFENRCGCSVRGAVENNNLQRKQNGKILFIAAKCAAPTMQDRLVKLTMSNTSGDKLLRMVL